MFSLSNFSITFILHCVEIVELSSSTTESKIKQELWRNLCATVWYLLFDLDTRHLLVLSCSDPGKHWASQEVASKTQRGHGALIKYLTLLTEMCLVSCLVVEASCNAYWQPAGVSTTWHILHWAFGTTLLQIMNCTIISRHTEVLVLKKQCPDFPWQCLCADSPLKWNTSTELRCVRHVSETDLLLQVFAAGEGRRSMGWRWKPGSQRPWADPSTRPPPSGDRLAAAPVWLLEEPTCSVFMQSYADFKGTWT